MPSAEQPQSPDNFDTYDFESDPRWVDYKSNLTIPPGRSDEEAIFKKYKHKFFKLHVNPDHELPAVTSQPASSASTAGSRPQPRPAAAVPPNVPPSGGPSQSAARAQPASGASGQRLDQGTILFLCNTWVVVMAALCAFPLTPPRLGSRAFLWCLLGSAASSLYSIFATYGRPAALNLEALKNWAQPLVSGPELLRMLHAIAFLPSRRPIAFAVAPLGLTSALAVAQHLQRNFSRAQVYRQYLERPCVWLQQNSAQLHMWSASLDIYMGFTLVFFLLTPQRSLVQLVLYWQLLKLKYHSPATMYLQRQAWSQIQAKFEPYIFRYAPFLSTPLGYAKRWFQNVR